MSTLFLNGDEYVLSIFQIPISKLNVNTLSINSTNKFNLGSQYNCTELYYVDNNYQLIQCLNGEKNLTFIF